MSPHPTYADTSEDSCFCPQALYL